MPPLSYAGFCLGYFFSATLSEENGGCQSFAHIEQVAQGGLSTVSRVLAVSTKEFYALKAAKHPRAEYFIKREKEALEGLKGCPYIVPLLGEREDSFGLGLVLPLYRTDLWALIKNNPLSPRGVDTVVKSVSTALWHLKDRGVVHADIKGVNIFVSEDGDVVLGDFGAAFSIEARPARDTYGTRYYIPPEGALHSGEHGPKADIWSLGCTVFECVTKTFLFETGTRENPRDPLSPRIEFRGDLIPLHEGTMGKKYPKNLLEEASEEGKLLYGIYEGNAPDNEQVDKLRAVAEQFQKKSFELLHSRIGNALKKRADWSQKQVRQLSSLLHAMLEFDPEDRIPIQEMLINSLAEEKSD